MSTSSDLLQTSVRRLALAMSLVVTIGAAGQGALADDGADLTDRPIPRPVPVPRPRPDTPDRPRLPRPEPGTTRIDPSQMETVRKGPALQFRGFEVKDPSTGRGNEAQARTIPANTLLSLPNGKQIPAGEYYQQLNQFENHVNEFGYSLRERSQEPIELSRLKIDLGELKRHTDDARIKRTPGRAVPRIPVDTAKSDHIRRIGTISGIKDSIGRWGRLPGGGIKQPRTFNASKSWSGAWGWSNTLGVYVDTSVQVNATSTASRAAAQGASGGHIFGKKLAIVRGESSYNAPASGNLTGDTAFYFLGIKLFSKNYNGPNPLFFSSGWQKGLDANNQIYFTLGPIPMSAKIGARGEARLDFRMNLIPLHANADITPSVTSKVYVQVGVDVVVGGAGAGGDLIFINDTVPVVARMHLANDSQGPYYYASLEASDEMTALAGKIYAYVYIYVPAWDIPPWHKKQWDWTIFKWNGIHANGSLFAWNSRLNLY